jgi:hypothetical protein
MPLQRPADELEELAAYYDTHDTSEEMEHGEWIEPLPVASVQHAATNRDRDQPGREPDTTA